MPIEIKELHIRVNVEEGINSESASNTAELTEEKQQQIIAACVKQVMQMMKDKKER